MKAAAFSLLAAAVVLAVLAVSDDAEASTTCHASGNWCQGYSHVSTITGGISSARCFELKTTNSAGTCSTSGITPSNLSTWELDAAGCLTFYFFETTSGASPPAAPNKMTIAARFADTAGDIKVYQVQPTAPPASGTSYTFCATSDGVAGSSPRAGTVELYLRAIKDTGPGGVGNYDINTRGVAAVGSLTNYDIGILRAKTILASATVSAPPSGTLHAYGPASDEVMTVTATFTQPFGDANVETGRTFLTDEATLTLGQAGSTVDIDATTTLAQNPYVVDNTFTISAGNYVAGFSPIGNSVITSLKWTTFASAGHGSCIVVATDTVAYCDTNIDIDSRIRLDSDTAGGFASADETDRSYAGGTCSGTIIDLFNRGEMACTAWSAVNARSEYLSRSMTFGRYDGSNVLCANYGALSPTSNVYSASGAFSTGGSCAAANDLTGSTRHLRVTNTDQSYDSGTIYRISSLYRLTEWTDLETPRSGTSDLQFFVRDDGAGGDATDTIHSSCRVRGVRDDVDIDTSGSAVSQQLKDPTGATRATRTTDTDSSGWTDDQDLLASTPLGDDWMAPCSVAFNGNTGSATATFEVGVEGGGGGETIYTGADPLTIFADQPRNGTVPVAVHSRLLTGEARIGVADQIFVSAFDWPAMTPVVTDQAVVEVDQDDAPGGYAYAFTPPYDGTFLLAANTTDGATPIGAFTVITISGLEDALMHETTFASLTGFTGPEFLAVLAVALAGVIVWIRSTDTGIRVLGAVLCILPGVIVILLTVQVGIGALWAGSIGLGIVLVATGVYMVIRMFLEEFLEKRAAGEA